MKNETGQNNGLEFHEYRFKSSKKSNIEEFIINGQVEKVQITLQFMKEFISKEKKWSDFLVFDTLASTVNSLICRHKEMLLVEKIIGKQKEQTKRKKRVKRINRSK